MTKNKLTFIMVALLLAACAGPPNTESEDTLDVTSQFNSTWNIHEHIQHHDDGGITYESVMWGGLASDFSRNNMPADWSGYDGIVFEFAQPTTVETQIVVTDRLVTRGKAGITSLRCSFGGQDVTAVKEVALQTVQPTTLYVSRIYLLPLAAALYSTPIWNGECVLGNWTGSFTISAEKFATAHEGDRLELVYTTDRSNPTITYWQLKTMIGSRGDTLEGNANELNEWGCVTVGEGSSDYRINLTARDVALLKENGLEIRGYFTTVTQCNLLQPGEAGN